MTGKMVYRMILGRNFVPALTSRLKFFFNFFKHFKNLKNLKT